MIKVILVTAMFPMCVYAQKIKVDEIDKFTKQHKVFTTEAALREGMDFQAYIFGQKYDNDCYLTVRLSIGSGKTGKVFSVPEGASMIFVLDNDETLDIKNAEYELSSIGAAAKGLSGSQSFGAVIKYKLNEQALKVLAQQKIKAYRIYLSDSYIEADANERQSERLYKIVNLINDKGND